MVRPNGLAFSDDERLLYVADTGACHLENGPRHIRSLPVAADGPIVRRAEVFAECAAGLFDGFRVDGHGHIWTSSGDGVHFFDPDATLIGKILIPEIVANVTFGGAKRNRLFICATPSLYAVLLMTNGSKLG